MFGGSGTRTIEANPETFPPSRYTLVLSGIDENPRRAVYDDQNANQLWEYILIESGTERSAVFMIVNSAQNAALGVHTGALVMKAVDNQDPETHWTFTMLGNGFADGSLIT